MLDRTLSTQEQAIIKALPLYSYATIDQIMRHIDLDPTDAVKVRGTQKKLKTLVELGYLKRINRKSVGEGVVKFVYILTEKSRQYVSDEKMEVKIPDDDPSFGFLEHILETNELLLLAVEFGRLYEGIDLQEAIHDLTLKRLQLSVIPDGFITFKVTIPSGETHYYPMLIELDRGGEKLSVIEKKIEDYIEFFKGEYQRVFNLQTVTVVFFTTGTEIRLLNMQKTIEKVLTKFHLERIGQFFYLGLTEEKAADALFFSDHFIVPFQGTKRFPLLASADLPGFPDQRQ